VNRPDAYNNTNEVVNFLYQSGAILASVALVNHMRTPLSNLRAKQEQGQPYAPDTPGGADTIKAAYLSPSQGKAAGHQPGIQPIRAAPQSGCGHPPCDGVRHIVSLRGDTFLPVAARD
jgi:hypothetical protein